MGISVSRCLYSTLHRRTSETQIHTSSPIYLPLYLIWAYPYTTSTSCLFFFNFFKVFIPKVFLCKFEYNFFFSMIYMCLKRGKKPPVVKAKERGKKSPCSQWVFISSGSLCHLFLWQGEKRCISEALHLFSWPPFSPLPPSTRTPFPNGSPK